MFDTVAVKEHKMIASTFVMNKVGKEEDLDLFEVNARLWETSHDFLQTFFLKRYY